MIRTIKAAGSLSYEEASSHQGERERDRTHEVRLSIFSAGRVSNHILILKFGFPKVRDGPHGRSRADSTHTTLACSDSNSF